MSSQVNTLDSLVNTLVNNLVNKLDKSTLLGSQSYIIYNIYSIP